MLQDREHRKPDFLAEKTAERITPNIGFVKPKTATLPTGLYLSNIPHKVYATAEIIAIYIRSAIDARVNPEILPPVAIPTTTRIIPPKRTDNR